MARTANIAIPSWCIVCILSALGVIFAVFTGSQGVAVLSEGLESHVALEWEDQKDGPPLGSSSGNLAREARPHPIRANAASFCGGDISTSKLLLSRYCRLLL